MVRAATSSTATPTTTEGLKMRSKLHWPRRATPARLATTFVAALAAVAGLLAAAPAAAAGIPATGTPGDWQQFGDDPRHSGTNPLEPTLQPGTAGTLHLLYSVRLPGTEAHAPVLPAGRPTAAR